VSARILFPLLAAGLLLTGCSSLRTEMGQPLPMPPKAFTKGQTRADAVMRDLGPPNRVSRLPDGFAFLYEYSLMCEIQLGIRINVPVLQWFKFIKAWNHLEQENLLLTFDEHGVLRSIGAAKWDESLGGGGGVQFLFTVMTFSDIARFLRPGDAHEWGKMLLQPPPVALNSAQSLRSGEHGLQQRIAPDYVGQHTLEMIKPQTEREKRKTKKDYQSQPKGL
jgi:hypothetical protein